VRRLCKEPETEPRRKTALGGDLQSTPQLTPVAPRSNRETTSRLSAPHAGGGEPPRSGAKPAPHIAGSSLRSPARLISAFWSFSNARTSIWRMRSRLTS